MPTTYHPGRPPPLRSGGIVAWLRRNLFSDWKNAVGTIVIIALLARYLPGLLDWALGHAMFQPDNAGCRALQGVGACWGVIAEKYRAILFGRYPFAEQWRPLLATLLMLALLVASCARPSWGKALLPYWLLGLGAVFFLMRGGAFGLEPVDTARWGGLPLTLMLSILGIVMAFPLAVLLALGRRSELPAVRAPCVGYIELIRGVPLISVLFMASFMFPLFLPPDVKIDVLVRVLAGISLFAAAYLAEVIRGGLQAIPLGQIEAAAALGLSYWQIQRKIALPQALRAVVPAIMNSFISTFKDTSLVTIVSLYELTGALSLALSGDAIWRPFYLEGYLFVASIYWVGCFAMSRYSLRVERRLNQGVRRV
jgi:general L-amino acid transport system permease protein